MKRSVIASALVLSAAGPVWAADLPPAPPPPRAPAAYAPAVGPVYNWGGIYIGANGGGGLGTSEWTNASPLLAPTPSSGSFDLSGALVGGTLGVNFQATALVFGLEADLAWSTIKGSTGSSYCGGPVTACETKNTWLGTARGRIGFAANRALIYATGGAAFGNIETGFVRPTGTTYDTTNRVGWTAGGGVEFAFIDNWSAKLEYLYVDLGSGTCATTVNCGTPAGDSVSFAAHTLRAGINFKFGGSPATVAARY